MALLDIPTSPSADFLRIVSKAEEIKDEKLFNSIPVGLTKPNPSRGLLGLLTSFSCIALSVFLLMLVDQVWLMIPLWFFAGLSAWGAFVIGHDCGHNSFSRSKILNQVVGQIALLPILFPFNGWRLMHNMHHSSANNIELDVDWSPITIDQFKKLGLYKKSLYFLTRKYFWFLGTVRYQLNCFVPGNFVSKKARREVALSALFTLVFGIAVITILITTTGLSGFAKYFLMPWIFMHFWFSTVTMMQHVSEDIPYLTSKYWTANASRLLLINDYKYPWLIQFLMHNITVHTAHHVAPLVPFYNLPAATEALRTKYPNAMREKKFSVGDLYRVLTRCTFYDPVGGFYDTRRVQGRQLGGSAGTQAASIGDYLKECSVDLLTSHSTIRAVEHLSYRVAGFLAANAIELTKPRYSRSQNAIVTNGCIKEQLENGTEVLYWQGDGSKGLVVLLHGWGSEHSSMLSFVPQLLKTGFSVCAFDAPGHGVNPGYQASIVDYEQVITSVLKYYGNVTAIVSHSMGCIAAAGAINSLNGSKVIEPLTSVVFLASPVSLVSVIENWAFGSVHITEKTFQHLDIELERRNGLNASKWDIRKLLAREQRPFLLVHDIADEVIPYQASKNIGEQLVNSEVMTVHTNGSGKHIRILINAEVVSRVTSYINARQKVYIKKLGSIDIESNFS
ncbi:alpha/beta fold hydrolase [Reinekea sp.]|jgi:omega-6 fatty acid desaturase (delta-12 desaturase)|uniref:alpha/beta fold hydrolase n=1 Tax=Reinekea sp. TaxID=1970455 RepID=UPI002A7F36B0|nr:alpha/beta fold hydrolase [Reinekea sp.]